MDIRHSPRILVVDDEQHICSVIAEALAAEDCQVTAMTDPAAALEYIRSYPLDLVLSDLVMGAYSGEQILKATLEAHADAIVIMMTAHPTLQSAISVLRNGAYDFLVKPFKLELLKATIQRGLGHQRLVRENVRLKAQVEFLRVANAASTKVTLPDILALVARSCVRELEAAAVGIIEVDPDGYLPVRQVYEAADENLKQEVLDVSVIEQFRYTKSTQPKVSSYQVTDGDQQWTRIFISQPMFSRRRLQGVINILIRSRFDNLTPGQISVLTILANSAASAITNQRLYHELKTSYLQAIRGLANAIEARDECTAGHTDRVCRLAELVARHLGWDERKLDALAMGCTLHDIGKIGVPDRVLNKPERLTDAERERMRAHPEVGLTIIDGIDLFRPAIPYIIAHHEWFDGSGYPNGLAGEQIPIEGRLLAVVDTLDAILSDRPYRQGTSLEIALAEILKHKGTQFDPQIVNALLEVIRLGQIDFEMMYGRRESLDQLSAMLVTETAPA